MPTDDSTQRLAAVQSESLSGLAYQSLKRSILTGRLRPGEQLVETKVSEELRISRAPLREAFIRLRAEGLMEDRPRQGTFVREFTHEDFVDIYNLRIAVECLAARLVILKRPSLIPLEEACIEMRAAARADAVHDVITQEQRFHHELCIASGNRYLAQTFESLEGPIQMAISLDDMCYENLHDIADEHLPILAVLRGTDQGLAVSVMEEHILATVGPVLARLGGDRADLLQPFDTRPAPS